VLAADVFERENTLVIFVHKIFTESSSLRFCKTGSHALIRPRCGRAFIQATTIGVKPSRCELLPELGARRLRRALCRHARVEQARQASSYLLNENGRVRNIQPAGEAASHAAISETRRLHR